MPPKDLRKVTKKVAPILVSKNLHINANVGNVQKFPFSETQLPFGQTELP